MRRGAAGAAVVLVAVGMAAGGVAPAWAARELAAVRYAEVIHRMRYKIQDKSKPPTPTEIEAMAPVALALGEDLTDPAVSWSEKRPALEALQHLRQAGRPAIPALVQGLDLYPADNGPQGVGHFCEVTEALSAIDATDVRGIRAVSIWLETVRATAICHRCGCALRLLEAAGPAARPIAAPVLERIARGRLLINDDWQLGETLKAVGVSEAMAAALLQRVTDENVSPDDRAGTLRALGQDADAVGGPDRAELTRIAAELLAQHRHRPLREAAAETLGFLGPPALEPLRLAVAGDRDYRVRAKAATALARLGPAASRAASELLEALDPFRGTAREAAAALVAIGPLARSALEERTRQAPMWLRPLLLATARALASGNVQAAQEALKQFTPGPGGHGFVRIEVRRGGSGPTFDPSKHRARLRVKGGAIGPGGEGLPRFDLTLNERGPNMVFGALAGQREGDRLHLVLSPEIAQSPLAGTERWMREERFKFAVPEGTAAAYDVEIVYICEPVIWRPIRGGGWLSDMQFELYCKRPAVASTDE